MSSAIFSTVKTITPIVRKPPASNHKNSVVAGLRAVVVRDTGPYSARNSSKGALIDEASRIFAALARGLPVDTVREQVLRGTLLTQRSRENRKRIWTSIHQRYLIPTTPWLTSLVAGTSTFGPHGREFVSLLYLLYALRDRLTFDFVTDVLWAKCHDARPVISRNEVLDFLKQAAGRQPQIERWTDSTRIKLAGSILTALRDFGVLEGQQKKVLARPVLPPTTAEALLRVLIVEGCRGRQAVQDSTWRLFLFTEQEVASTLAKLAQLGRIRFEKIGTTVVLETPAEWQGP
jgi:hypothetical protein